MTNVTLPLNLLFEYVFPSANRVNILHMNSQESYTVGNSKHLFTTNNALVVSSHAGLAESVRKKVRDTSNDCLQDYNTRSNRFICYKY